MQHTFKLKKRATLATYCIAPATGAMVVAFLTATVSIDRYLHRSYRELAAIAAHINDETAALSTSFKQVASVQAPPCSLNYVQALGKLVFTSLIVEDIIYRRGSVACSAEFGDALSLYDDLWGSARGIAYALPDNSEIRRNVRFRFAPQVAYTLLTKGAETLVFQSSLYPKHLKYDPTVDVKIIARTTQGPRSIDDDHTIDGVPERGLVSTKPLGVFGSLRLLHAGRLTAATCTSDGLYCATATIPLKKLILATLPEVVAFTILGGVVGYAAGTLLLSWQARRATLPEQLRQALRDDQFEVVYQPIVDAKTEAIVAAEALIRWTACNGRIIPPDIFIPAAEAAGFVGSITCAVIRRVGDELSEVLTACDQFRVSINIVPTDLGRPEFYQAIKANLEERGIRPQQVAFEITERQEIKAEVLVKKMSELRLRGYKFYVDDFGTGYSNVSYLGDLPIDAIKIDRSFTMAVGTDNARARLLTSMLDMARESSITVIAEGVETEGQATYFRAHQTAQLQGWLYGKAMPAEALKQLIPRKVPAPQR